MLQETSLKTILRLRSHHLIPICHGKNFIELVTRAVAGLHGYKLTIPTYSEGVDVVIIVYDVTNRHAVLPGKSSS